MTDNRKSARASVDWAAYDAAAAAIRSANKTQLFAELERAGITSVRLTFDGYGDEGQIESIDAHAGSEPAEFPESKVTLTSLSWCDPEPTDRTMTLPDAVEQLAYDCLTATHLGWENNDGAYGTFVFDVAARTIALEHHERFVDVQTFNHEL